MSLPAPAPTATHRDRLVFGLAESIRERGYRETKLSDVVRHARTSRRTFYEHFEDKEACFLALFEATNDNLVREISEAVDGSARWDTQVDQAIGAYVDAAVTEPALTVSFTREMPALGEAGAARQREAMQQFADLLMRLVNTDEMRRAGVEPMPRLKAVMLVGALREILVSTVEEDGDLDEIRTVASDVIKAVLAPVDDRPRR